MPYACCGGLRFELVVNDAEVKVGGMLCDRSHFDMLKSFAESEAKGSGASWAADIDQDVTYVYMPSPLSSHRGAPLRHQASSRTRPP